MMLLTVFGRNCEALAGDVATIAFYIVPGLLAEVATLYTLPGAVFSDVPAESVPLSLGASAAVYGVMGAGVTFRFSKALVELGGGRSLDDRENNLMEEGGRQVVGGVGRSNLLVDLVLFPAFFLLLAGFEVTALIYNLGDGVNHVAHFVGMASGVSMGFSAVLVDKLRCGD